MTWAEYEQSLRLLAVAEVWFERARDAQRHGRSADATVAVLAHAMTAAAYDNLLRESAP